jgi:hypothetical protein
MIDKGKDQNQHIGEHICMLVTLVLSVVWFIQVGTIAWWASGPIRFLDSNWQPVEDFALMRKWNSNFFNIFTNGILVGALASSLKKNEGDKD